MRCLRLIELPPDQLGQVRKVPCGQCRACRINRTESWALRIMHEAEGQPSAFVTLTFSDEALWLRKEHHDINPDSLGKKVDLPLFWKRLRKAIAPTRIRYFAAGEYGDQFGRPHYHAAIFGCDFQASDACQALEKAWGQGHVWVDKLEIGSARYVAKYIQKKLDAQAYELDDIEPEFAVMSRGRGIGRDYYDRHIAASPLDYIYVRGRKVALPRYYADLKGPSIGRTAEKRRIIKEKEVMEKEDAARSGKSLWHDRLERQQQQDLNLKKRS